MQAAADMLLAGKRTSEIALELGYLAPQNFNRAFLNYWRCTPGEYRKARGKPGRAKRDRKPAKETLCRDGVGRSRQSAFLGISRSSGDFKRDFHHPRERVLAILGGKRLAGHDAVGNGQ